MTRVRYTHNTYEAKITTIFPGYKLLSKFIKTGLPIKYQCDKGHINESRADSLVANHGCKTCAHEVLGNIHRLKPFKFTLRNSKIKINEIYVLPAPYNTYKMQYLGKGKWNLFSSRGKVNPSVGPLGHLVVGLCDVNQKARGFGIHQLVYAIKKNSWDFLERIEDGYTIDHIDRNPQNNRPSNLRIASKALQARNQNTAYIQDFETLVWVYKQRIKRKTHKSIAAKLGCEHRVVADALRGRTHQELIIKLPKSLIKQARAVKLHRYDKDRIVLPCKG